MDHHYFEFSLHLCNGQLFIHSLLLGGKQYLWDVDVKENMGESLEPTHPIFFSIFQIDLPSIVFLPVFLILD